MNFLQNLNKNILVLLSLGLGIFFILYADPPVTVCKSIKSNFIKSQKGFLFVNKESSAFKKKSFYKKLYKLCDDRKSPGSCYQLFYKSKSLLLDLNNEAIACLAQISELQSFLKNNIQLMTEIAWGPTTPSKQNLKLSWMQEPDFNLFCTLLQTYEKAFGAEKKSKLEKKIISKLPGYNGVNFAKAYQLSLFSIDCKKY